MTCGDEIIYSLMQNYKKSIVNYPSINVKKTQKQPCFNIYPTER